MSNRTHKMMARREWAAKLIADDTFTVFLDRDNVQVVGKNAAEDRLRKEHARAVRIVKRLQQEAEKAGRLTEYNVLADVLAALTKGRA